MGSQVKIDQLEPNADEREGSKTRERKTKPRRPTARAENELRDRLTGCFERISESLQARDDPELADIVREDAEVIAQGLVSLTRPFTAMRTVVLAAVAIVEPLMAFGRIGRVLGSRWAERRAMRAQEQEPSQHE